MSTWTPSTRRSSSATIRRCAASRSRSAAGIAAWSRRRATRRANIGVRSAMPSVTAQRRCPELIFVKPRFDAYREVSHQIRAIFPDYTPQVEPLSLDEAYLDVTEDLKGIGIATRIAEEIRARIRAETGLTASAGVSYNKFLAKLRQRPEQARRPVRDPAGQGRGLRRRAAGQALPRRRPEDGGEDGAARHRDRRRPARPEPRLPRPQFRQLAAIIITTSPAASATARSSPTGPTSRSAPRTRSSRI